MCCFAVCVFVAASRCVVRLLVLLRDVCVGESCVVFDVCVALLLYCFGMITMFDVFVCC